MNADGLKLGSVSSVLPVSTSLAAKDPKKVEESAHQFEAILIEQMLKSAHAAGGGSWMGEDEAGSALSDMAEQQFAQLIANNGGIGLAKLVKQGFENK